MGAPMPCPLCQVELGIERREGELVLTYNFKDWRTHCACRDRGDPVLCSNLLPTILTLLTEGRATPLGTVEPAKVKASS
jgi:hypothetical protein